MMDNKLLKNPICIQGQERIYEIRQVAVRDAEGKLRVIGITGHIYTEKPERVSVGG